MPGAAPDCLGRQKNRRVTWIALTRKIQSACSASNDSTPQQLVRRIAANVANDGIDPF